MSAEYPRRYEYDDLIRSADRKYIDASDFDAREALWRELVKVIYDRWDDSIREWVSPEPKIAREAELRRLLGIEEGA